MDPVGRVTLLILLFVLDAEHPLPSIELVPQHLVCLNEAVQFCSQVLILNLEHVGVALERLLLRK